MDDGCISWASGAPLALWSDMYNSEARVFRLLVRFCRYRRCVGVFCVKNISSCVGQSSFLFFELLVYKRVHSVGMITYSPAGFTEISVS